MHLGLDTRQSGKNIFCLFLYRSGQRAVTDYAEDIGERAAGLWAGHLHLDQSSGERASFDLFYLQIPSRQAKFGEVRAKCLLPHSQFHQRAQQHVPGDA